MKPTISSLALRGLALVILFSTVLVSAQVRETPATLALVEGGNPQGYVQGTNEQGVLFATSPGGQAQLGPYARIRGEGLQKLIRFEERAELLGTPRALFSAGQYNEAAEAYGKVARDYAIILSGPQNFASEALFYQIESLKRAGQYAALAPLVNSPAAATILTKLSESYKRPFELQKLWAFLGQNDFAGLKAALEPYQEPQTGDAKLLKSPNFVKLPPTEISQIAFLRAKVYESEGAKDKALEDYYRSFTLAYGNDILLSKLSMGGAMLIQKDDPRLAEKNPNALNQMQSIAYFFGRRFGKESMPAQFQAFAVKPVLPKQAPSAPKKEETPAEGGAKPAGAAQPADGAKPADGKNKGEAPATPADAPKSDAKAAGDGKAK
jgi:tetratricopeptide (TPR) repeat protein